MPGQSLCVKDMAAAPAVKRLQSLAKKGYQELGKRTIK
jgi:hypothetical protein